MLQQHLGEKPPENTFAGRIILEQSDVIPKKTLTSGTSPCIT
jgi:hypothetical protein